MPGTPPPPPPPPPPRHRRGSLLVLATVWAGLLTACAAGGGGGIDRPRPQPAPTPGLPVAEEAAWNYGASSGSFRYYRLDSLDYHLPGGASHLQTHGRTTYLHVAVTPADSVFEVRFRLDSITQDLETVREPALDSVRTVSWVAKMGPTGGLYDFQVFPPSAFGENLSSELARRFFPDHPPGLIEPGTSWTDSTETTIGGLSVTQTERAIVRSEAVRAVDTTGGYAVRIESAAQLERQGSSTQTGDVIEARGTGVDSTTYYLGPAGSFLGAEGTEQFELLFTVPAVGQTVPVRRVRRYRVERLRPER